MLGDTCTRCGKPWVSYELQVERGLAHTECCACAVSSALPPEARLAKARSIDEANKRERAGRARRGALWTWTPKPDPRPTHPRLMPERTVPAELAACDEAPEGWPA